MTKGGRRENAGRPSLAPEEKRVTVTFRVTPDTAKKIAGLRKKGTRVGRLIDEILSSVED